MATRAKSKSRSKSRSRSTSGTRGGNGVRVTPDTSNPRVARITIEIDWDELIARVARKMGQTIKSRRAARARRSQRAAG